MARSYQRAQDQLRPLKLSQGIAGCADGSVLFEIGKTKVLCTVSLSGSVPHFLRGKSKWWLTASYSLLPASTKNRVERESNTKRNDRSAEISRLIGRSLRSIVALQDKNSERTIHIDCDVIQADGGTRTACITGAFMALRLAEQKWIQNGLLEKSILQDEIAAISVGVLQDKALLDIDFAEDSAGVADFNFVMNRSGAIVEMQGSAEKHPISWELVQELRVLAFKGIQELFAFSDGQIQVPEQVSSGNRLQISLRDLISEKY